MHEETENLMLLLLVVLIAAVPLVWNSGAEFAGDDQVKDAWPRSPKNKPWFARLVAAVSEVEVFSFCAAGCDRRRFYRLLVRLSAGASGQPGCLITDAVSGLSVIS